MSHFLPDPAAPGTVEPEYLDKVGELHATVRKWLEDSAVQQKNDHIRANFPYADLMFAFAFATLGDHPTAKKLVEDARRVMEGPIPEGGDPRAEQAVTAALTKNFLFKAFCYRVDQALGGKSLGGQLSAEVMNYREEIRRRTGTGRVNNPYMLALYVIDRFRDQSRIVEPAGAVDPYSDWTKHGDVLKRALGELHTIREPAVLAERIRHLYQHGVEDKPLKELQFYVLHEGLLLSARVNEAFTMELLALVPAALSIGSGSTTESPDLPKKQAELLERALFLAGHFSRGEIVSTLVDEFTTLVRAKPEWMRYRLISYGTRQCLFTLKKLGLRDELDRLLINLHREALGGVSTAELRKKYSSKPESWSAALQTLLNLAGGWLFLGLPDRANPILTEARNELLIPGTLLPTKEYTELARAYVSAWGQSQATETGLGMMIELFRKMDPKKITNTWATAQYYSRFHLNLVEDTVLALCQRGPEVSVPVIVTA